MGHLTIRTEDSRGREQGAQRRDTYGVRAVARTVAILKAFHPTNSGLGVSDLATRVNLHKSTAHRILVTLEREGFVVQDRTAGRYRLGLPLLELASAVLDGLDVRQIARPLLEEIHRACGETVHLGTLDEGQVVYIDKIESIRRVRMYSKIGKRAPAHCTALGKVLLSGLPDHLLTWVIDRTELQSYTSTTITSPRELREHLALVRRQGYAVDAGEHEELIRCAAAPVYDHMGQVVAAMSITTVGVDVTSHLFREYIALVRKSARLASEALGYRTPGTRTEGRP